MQAAVPALLVGGTAFGAATSAVGASNRNRAVSRSMKSANAAASTQLGQLAQQAALERYKRIREAQTIAGKLRVAAAESGAGPGGSWSAIEQQNILDSRTDTGIIDANYGASSQRVLSGLDATNIQLQSETVNPIVASIVGGVQGLQTAINFAQGADGISRLLNTPPPREPVINYTGLSLPPALPAATTGFNDPALPQLPQIPDLAGSVFA